MGTKRKRKTDRERERKNKGENNIVRIGGGSRREGRNKKCTASIRANAEGKVKARTLRKTRVQKGQKSIKWRRSREDKRLKAGNRREQKEPFQTHSRSKETDNSTDKTATEIEGLTVFAKALTLPPLA